MNKLLLEAICLVYANLHAKVLYMTSVVCLHGFVFQGIIVIPLIYIWKILTAELQGSET